MPLVVPLLLLGLIGGVTAQTQTFHITGADGNNQFYIIDGNQDPTLTLTAGLTYAFSIEFVNSAHPFGFSTSATGVTLTDSGLVGNGNCTGSGTAGYKTTTTPNYCVLTYTAPATPQTLYYHCAVHSAMTGPINIVAASTGSNTGASSSSTGGASGSTGSSGAGASSSPSGTVSSTAGGATTSPPTLTPGATLTGTSFRVTDVQSDNTGPIAYVFTGPNGQTYVNPTLSVTPGTTVTFSLEYSGNHPFGFSPNNGNTVTGDTNNFPPPQNAADLVVSNGCQQATAGVPIYTPKTPGVQNFCTLTVPVTQAEAGTTLYYRCAIHPRMIGQLSVTGTASSSTGKNTASHVTGVGAVMALVVAFIAAICA